MKKVFLLMFGFFIMIKIYALGIAESSCEKIFTHIYNVALWGRNDRGQAFSGMGSLRENCVEYMAFLEKFMIEHNVKSVFDAGCGDWEFSRFLNWSGIDYLGCDVVAGVINENIKNFGSKNIKFINGDFLSIELPKADLFVCKQVFQHLSNREIIDFLKKLKNFKYCLITNDVDPKTLSSKNEDIKTGEYRWVDLSKPPFNAYGEKILNYESHNWMHQVFFIDNTRN